MRPVPPRSVGCGALLVVAAVGALAGCAGGYESQDGAQAVAVEAGVEDSGAGSLRTSISADEYTDLAVAMSLILSDAFNDHWVSHPSPQVPELRVEVDDSVSEADVRAALTREAVGAIAPVAFEVSPDWDELFTVDIVNLARDEDGSGPPS